MTGSQILLKWPVLPFLVSLLLSGYFPDSGFLFLVQAKILPATERRAQVVDDEALIDGFSNKKQPQQDGACWQRMISQLGSEEQKSVQELMDLKDDGVPLTIHRNGDVDECGTSADFLSQLQSTFNSLSSCPETFEKYQVESIITRALHRALPSCASVEADRQEEEGFLGYCDMGKLRTPILLDHDKLVPIEIKNQEDRNVTYLPCHFHTREGVRIASFQALVSLLRDEYKREPSSDNCQENEQEQTCLPPEKNVDLYAVPAGRVFMYAPKYVGEIFDLPHIQGADPTKPVYIKVISISPRVFDIFNFFTREESDGLVEKALAETSESHRIKRSSTGASGYNINNRRTSENGFDTHGKTAQAVKRRCFEVLGFDEYIESHSDGLQILRYNQTKAYTAHMDWIDDDGKQEHNYDSGGKGGNRYATILLYMADLMGDNDGGETVFVKGKPLDKNVPDYRTALAELRQSEQGALFQLDSWEEKLVARCRSSLAIRPNSARAVLFYSQLPNGQPDPASLHGGCPVISDTPKWAGK